MADSTALHLQAEHLKGELQPPCSLSPRLCGAEFTGESCDIWTDAVDVLLFSAEGPESQLGVLTFVLIRPGKTDGCF